MPRRLFEIKEKYPVPLVLAATAVFMGVLIAAAYGFAGIPALAAGGEYTVQLAVELVGAALAVGAVFLFGCAYIFKEKKYGFFRSLVVGMYFVVVIGIASAANVINGLQQNTGLRPPLMIVVFVLVMFLIGVTEEFFFRGVVAEILLKKYGKDSAGVWFCVLFSGAVFGAIHILNAIGIDSLSGVLVQSMGAAVLGMALCAVYYRTKNIWAVVVLHAAVDFVGLIPSGLFAGEGSLSTVIASYSLFNLIGIIPYLVLTVFLLRPKKIREITGGAPSSRSTKALTASTAGVLAAVYVFTAAMLVPSTLSKLPAYFGANTVCSFSGTFIQDFNTQIELERDAVSTVTVDVKNNGGRIIDVILTDESGGVLMERISGEEIRGTEFPDTPAGRYDLRIVIIGSREQLNRHIAEQGYVFSEDTLASLYASLDGQKEDWEGARISFSMTAMPRIFTK